MTQPSQPQVRKTSAQLDRRHARLRIVDPCERDGAEADLCGGFPDHREYRVPTVQRMHGILDLNINRCDTSVSAFPGVSGSDTLTRLTFALQPPKCKNV